MKIYINYDNSKEIAIKTKDKLIELSDELNIEVVDKPHDADFAFVVGGDGTFLKTSSQTDKPLVGINCGTLGFLTDTNPEDIKPTLIHLIDGTYEIENRMMIEGEIIRKDETIRVPPSLNDICIAKNNLGILRFTISIDSKLISHYAADGLILCTPTGSTAYNFSCGGPVCDPTAKIITITPIAPHTLLNRSMILSDESLVEIKMGEIRSNTTAFLMYDGNSIEIDESDIIRIKKSDKVAHIVKFDNQSFIDNIRTKIN